MRSKPHIKWMSQLARDVWCPNARYAWVLIAPNGIGYFGHTPEEAWREWKRH